MLSNALACTKHADSLCRSTIRGAAQVTSTCFVTTPLRANKAHKFNTNVPRRAQHGISSTQRARDRGQNAGNLVMGTIVADSTRSASIQDILSTIMPRLIRLKRTSHSNPSLLTLLLTTTFAEHAFSSELPLQILKRIGEENALASPLDVVVGVVDRVPSPETGSFGHEGLAYLFSSAPERRLLPSQAMLQLSAQMPGSLGFQLAISSTVSTVQVPLAHTVFTTSLPSTLLYSRYEIDKKTGALQRHETRRLESQTIPLDIGSPYMHMSYRAPLIPLTPARMVASSMGNIVRKLLPYDWSHSMGLWNKGSSNDEQPSYLAASQELEAAVSRFFELRDLQPEPVQVWALVIPPLAVDATSLDPSSVSNFLGLTQATIEESWTSLDKPKFLGVFNSSSTSDAALHLVRRGARLCKVLSGGGGWGKKAGLISLDPDLHYTTRELRGESGWEFSFADEADDAAIAEQQRAALGQMFNEGDSIMFFLALGATSSVANSTISDKSGKQMLQQSSSEQSFAFGSLPSSVDDSFALEESPTPSTNTNGQIRHHPNFFGILSEGGMALSSEAGNESGIPATKSKIDVPHGRLTITGVQERHSVDMTEVTMSDAIPKQPPGNSTVSRAHLSTPTAPARGASNQTFSPSQEGSAIIRKFLANSPDFHETGLIRKHRSLDAPRVSHLKVRKVQYTRHNTHRVRKDPKVLGTSSVKSKGTIRYVKSTRTIRYVLVHVPVKVRKVILYLTRFQQWVDERKEIARDDLWEQLKGK